MHEIHLPLPEQLLGVQGTLHLLHNLPLQQQFLWAFLFFLPSTPLFPCLLDDPSPLLAYLWVGWLWQ
eukprot:550393-Prorocentrum_lima.AAC.1